MSTITHNSTCVAVAPTAPISEPAGPQVVVNGDSPAQTQTSEEHSTKDHQNPHSKRPQNNNHHENSNSNNRNKRRKRGKPPPATPPSPQGCSVCKVVKENEPPKYKCPKCRATYCSVACCRKHKEICPGKQETCRITTNSTKSLTQSTATATATATAESQRPTETAAQDAESSSTDYSSDDGDDSSLEDGWEITDDMKVALQNSTWLRSELQDGGLRDMIASVVKSERKYKSHFKKQRNRRIPRGRNGHRNFQQPPKHPHEELATKRQGNHNFDVFMDKLLVLADVLERQEETLDLETGQVVPGATAAVSNRNEEQLEEWLRLKWDPKMPPPALALKPKRKKAIPKFEPVEDVSSSSEDEEEHESS